ncbi:MFS general substrate transporter domain-containing protein [Dioscorea alata]|uniref:MFS general substrate transporter domain-containing protein n=1 Tax=Dioscorea alata TaxID=55571 RepID=A0ACB7VRF1_DIOAL|nr:MFS general substrate transporter domain-containing protein [Dioscorea alata]
MPIVKIYNASLVSNREVRMRYFGWKALCLLAMLAVALLLLPLILPPLPPPPPLFLFIPIIILVLLSFLLLLPSNVNIISSPNPSFTSPI